MTGYAGIDAGGTLIKIAYISGDAEKEHDKEPKSVRGTSEAGADHREPEKIFRQQQSDAHSSSTIENSSKSENGGSLSASAPVLVKFPIAEIEAAVQWVQKRVPRDTVIGFTGGQARRLREALPEYAASAVDVPEFEATAEGAVRILEAEAGQADTASERFVLVNVGTGTSLHLIEGGERPRLGGIGLGGGTIVGLTGLLCGVRDYDEIARLAPLGNREAVDLTVGQIYAPAPPPIAGDLTAANFARPAAPATGVRPQDYAAAVIGMVAEIVVTVGVQAAGLQGTNVVVYVGSSYENNSLLRELTLRFTNMLGAEARIPKRGPYSGAIGALHTAAAKLTK